MLSTVLFAAMCLCGLNALPHQQPDQSNKCMPEIMEVEWTKQHRIHNQTECIPVDNYVFVEKALVSQSRFLIQILGEYFFNEADVNKDNSVSEEEAKGFLEIMYPNQWKTIYQEYFQQYKDKKSKIGEQAFELVSSLPKYIAEDMDHNKNGCLTEVELKAGLCRYVRKVSFLLFKLYDKDKNNEISLEEYTEFNRLIGTRPINIKIVWNMADFNRDNIVTPEEYADMTVLSFSSSYL